MLWSSLLVCICGIQVIASHVPKSTVEGLNKTIVELFSKPRHDIDEKQIVREKMTTRFQNYGLESYVQRFFPTSGGAGGLTVGQNILGIQRGVKRKRGGEDILIIGAHYDTSGAMRNYYNREKCPGVEDNGSGSTAVFEIARILTENNCIFNKTIYFIAFDLEEYGALGSKHFVADYLIPNVIQHQKANVIGAYILDMILVYDEEEGSQNITKEMVDILPEWTNKIKEAGYRGDYISVRGRRDYDSYLFEKLNESWHAPGEFGGQIYKLYNVNPKMDKYFTNETVFNPFTRSDHRNFWYGHVGVPGNPQITIPAVGICDMANYRKSYRSCYHGSCDDTSRLTEKNLKFMKHTVDALIRTILNIGEGKCGINKSTENSFVFLLASVIGSFALCAALLLYIYLRQPKRSTGPFKHDGSKVYTSVDQTT